MSQYFDTYNTVCNNIGVRMPIPNLECSSFCFLYELYVTYYNVCNLIFPGVTWFAVTESIATLTLVLVYCSIFLSHVGFSISTLVNVHRRLSSMTSVECCLLTRERFMLGVCFRLSPQINEQHSSDARIEPRTYTLTI